MPNNNDIVRAIGDAIVQAAEYVNRDANDYSKSSIKNARIYGNQIKQNSVPGFVLKDGSIPGLKIVDLDFAKIKNVEIGNAHIANAGIDYAKIKDLHADSAYFGSQIFELGLGDELYIGRLRVNAANIAHLEVGELILESPDGTLYRLGVDEDGNVVTSVYEVQYQNIADMTKNLMSQYTIYRGTTPPETPYVGQLWVNTDTDIIKRCIAVTPDVIWEPVKASELHTSFINAVEKGLEILSTGVIDVKNGGNINVQSGGSLNVKASGSVVVESGGQIQLHSSDAITIGGYPMDVGGENLLIDTSDTERSKTFSGLTSTSLHDISPSGIELIKAGGRFSLRAYIKNISGSETVKICVYLTRSGSPSSTVYGDSNAITSGQSGYVVVRFNAPADTDIISGYVALQHASSEASSSTVGYKRVKLESGNVSTSWSPSSYDTASALASLNNEIDGKVEIWYYAGVPTTSNAPASTWTTTDLKDRHVGDLYYNTSTGIAYRYKVTSGVYSWEVVRDSGVIDALEDAANAQATADGKMQVFTGASTPKGPYGIGDLWVVDGASGFIKVSTQVRTTVDYQNANDWVLSGTDEKAGESLAKLADISSDNKITPVEKKAVKKEWDVIVGEYPKIVAEATDYSLTGASAYTNYAHATTGKYKLLNDYISPLLSDLSSTSTIVGSTFRATFKAYYDARQDLLNAITTKARTNLVDFINDTYTPAISVKNRIWYQPGVPTSSAVNDIWYDTDADPVKIYRANAIGVSSIVTSGNGWYDITSVALDQALKGLNSLGNGSYHFFQSSTRPKSAGESGGSQINIGDIWLYTGTSGTKYVNGATYRAVSTNPTTDSGWLAFVAGAVLTPHIALNANHLTLSGESDLTIANPLGGNAIAMNKDGVAIESGSNLTIKDGSGGNAINMDSTGMTLSSTGQLKLTSADSIVIGGSPFSVGGTNLLTGTSGTYANIVHSNVYYRSLASPTIAALGLVPGEVITVRAYLKTDANVPAGGYRLSVVESNGSENTVTTYGQFIQPSSEGFSSVTFAIRYDTVELKIIVRSSGSVNFTGTEQYKWLKIERGSMATDWSPSPQDTVDALAGIGTQITGLQTQVDGKIDTHFGATDPSTGWTAPQKATAVGDMWYNSTAKKLKRWNGASWDDINDQTAIDAYANAATAKDTADGKRRVFTTTPVPPYDVGDLWAGGSTGDLKRCSTAKAAGSSYAAGDWVLATKYTDDTAYNTFAANTLPGLQARVQVFYQTSKPTYTAVGDLWYDTDSNPLEVWKCTNVSTQAHTAFTDPVLTRALSAQTTANSKITTFVQSTTPTALAAGDLWLDTGNKNIWKRATAAGTGGWVQYLTAAGYVNSTGITIDGTDLTVKATGNLNLAADGNLNVQNGGNLNVLNGGDIEINNGGEINVASGGKINITTADDLVLGGQNITAFANNSINLTVKSLGEGGTNLIPNSDFQTGTDAAAWAKWTNYSGAILGSSAAYSLDGVKQSGYVACPAGDTIAGAYIDIPYYALEDQPMTLSLFAYLTSGQNALMAGRSFGGVFQYDAADVEISGSRMNYYLTDFQGTLGWQRMVKSFTVLSACKKLRVYFWVQSDGVAQNQYRVSNFKLERGTVATAWRPSPSDPASGVKTSYIDIATDHIDISTGGNLNLSGGNLNLTGGTGTTAIGISTNRADEYMMWAGNATPASAPFSVKRDGSVKATKIQQEYSQSFWDMADADAPAEFPIYIPSGYTIDSVAFTFQTKKARTFAKSSASGGSSSVTSEGGTASIGSPSDDYTGVASGNTGGTSPSTNIVLDNGTGHSHTVNSHTHSLNSHYHTIGHTHTTSPHTHSVSIPAHTHGINYGINEKSTLATSCALKVGATTIGTYSPNPSNPVEIKTYLSAGWNTVIVAPNNDARIVAYALVKLTPA